MLNRYSDVQRYLLVAIVALSLMLRIAFVIFTPDWQAPDEFAHFYIVKYLALTGDYPLSNPHFPWYEAFQPPLYYSAAGGVYILFYQWDRQPLAPTWVVDPAIALPGHNPVLIVLRLFSVLLGVGTILLAVRLVQQLFPGRNDLALYVAAWTGFLPTFIVNSSSVTNDAMANFLGAVALALMFQPPDRHRTLWLGFVMALGILTKANLWTFIPIFFVISWLQTKNFRRTLSTALPSIGIALLLSCWLFYWNYKRYGSLFGIMPGVQSGFPLTNHVWLDYWRTVRNFAWSFWAAAGRTYEIHLQPTVYFLVFVPAIIVVLKGLTDILATRRRSATGAIEKGPDHPYRATVTVLLAGVIIIAVAASYYSLMFPINCAWGKYMYPMLPALAVLFVVGFQQALGQTATRVMLNFFLFLLLAIDFHFLIMLGRLV
jgi:hypothetical protein